MRGRTQLLLLFAVFAVVAGAQQLPAPPPQLPLPPNTIIQSPSQLADIYHRLVGVWFSAIEPYAQSLFYVLAGLDMAVFGWNLWMNYHGDIRSAMMATANKVLIIGIFLDLLVNGQSWMTAVINSFVTLGQAASGLPQLTPSGVLLIGLQIGGQMLGQAATSGALLDLPTALALIAAALLILVAFAAICLQFVITLVQSYLAIGMGYFFLAFGGSRWTASYVERYFAFCVATGTKLMVLYMLTGAAQIITSNWIQQAHSVILSAASVEVALTIMCGAVIYAGVVWYCSSICSSIFGGSPNLSHSDFVSFMAPVVSAGVTSGLIAAGVLSGGAAASAAAAGGAVKAGTGAVTQAAASTGSAANGATTAAASNGSSVARAVGQLAQVGANTVGRVPHGGSHGAPPSFNGFHH